MTVFASTFFYFRDFTSAAFRTPRQTNGKFRSSRRRVRDVYVQATFDRQILFRKRQDDDPSRLKFQDDARTASLTSVFLSGSTRISEPARALDAVGNCKISFSIRRPRRYFSRFLAESVLRFAPFFSERVKSSPVRSPTLLFTVAQEVRVCRPPCATSVNCYTNDINRRRRSSFYASRAARATFRLVSSFFKDAKPALRSVDFSKKLTPAPRRDVSPAFLTRRRRRFASHSFPSDVRTRDFLRRQGLSRSVVFVFYFNDFPNVVSFLLFLSLRDV